MVRWVRFFVVLSTFVLPRYAFSGTISGQITVDTLKVADSPFIVTGNLLVPSWHTLTVEPGVVFKFNADLSFTVDGELKAVGTTADSIRFTSNLTSQQNGDWNGFLFNAASAGTLGYCVVEFSDAITVKNSAFEIKQSTLSRNTNAIDLINAANAVVGLNLFTGNENTAIRCTDSSVDILQNEISENTSLSSAILCQTSGGKIVQNTIRNNGNSGIECSQGATPNIWQNTFYNNDLGIVVNDSSAPVISNNIIVSNAQFGVAINDTAAGEIIQYNDVWGNQISDFTGTNPSVGLLTSTNANGDSVDAFNNLSMNPAFVDTAGRDFRLLAGSPCIDAGDPSNPAGIVFWASAPDLGAQEFDGTVPVELVFFRIEGRLLRWMTASETDNFGFEIERKDEAEAKFKKIAFLPGAGTTVIPQSYQFEDERLSGVYFYRLKQIDTDGAYEYSEIIRADFSGMESFALFSNYPNPFNPTTTIAFRIPGGSTRKQHVELSIFNSVGQRVAVLLDERKSPGEYKLLWNGVDNLGVPVSSGIYIYRLKFGEFVQTRTMTLVK